MRGISAVALAALAAVPSGVLAQAGGGAAWTRYYNGPIQRQDVGTAVAIGPGGRVAITGESEGLASDDDIATVVYDATGERLWVARYNGPANYIDRGVAVGFDSAGNVYTTGISWGGLRPQGSEYDYVTMKHSPTGQQLWVKRYNGEGNWSDTVTGMAVDNAGNVYLCGFAIKEPDQFNRYATHFHLLKYDTHGEIVWEHLITGSTHLGAGARAMHLDDAGNVYATGVVNGGDPWNNDDNILTVKVDAAGQLVYAKQWSSPGFNSGLDDGLAITADAAGNAYVAGRYMEDEPLLDEHLNTVVLKYGPTGDLLATGTLHLERPDAPSSIVVDDAGNMYVGGGWANSLDDDGYVASFGPDGQHRWTRIIDEPQEWDQQYIVKIAIGPDGNIHAAGDIQRSGGYDPVLYEYTPAGDLVRSTVYDFGSASDYLFDMAMGADGTIVLGGARPTTLTLFDYAVMRIPGEGGVCYANCDGSTVAPVLNVDDFTCFINEYAGAQALPHAQQVGHYANCDGSTVAPVLNVDDFTCFINEFASGCP